MSEKKYKYDTAASCNPDYGIYLHTGVFKSPNGSVIPIYNNNLSGPLGVTGSPNVIGDGFNPIPKVLKVGFYSETEDKFYEGEFNLPYEEIEKKLQEETDNPFFRDKTFIDSQSGKTLKYMKYNVLSVGITIGGKVTLWINGENRNQLEIACFQAQEANLVWNTIFEQGGREESFKYNLDNLFTPKVKKEILTKTLPFTLWDDYRKEYNWGYKFELPSGGKLDDIYMSMINAEAECIYDVNSLLENDSYSKRALPYNFEIRMNDGKGNKYLSWIVFTEKDQFLKNIYKNGGGNKYPEDFREEEVYKIFQSLDKTKPIDIVFRISESYKEIKIVIKQEEKVIPLTKVTAWLMSDN